MVKYSLTFTRPVRACFWAQKYCYFPVKSGPKFRLSFHWDSRSPLFSRRPLFLLLLPCFSHRLATSLYPLLFLLNSVTSQPALSTSPTTVDLALKTTHKPLVASLLNVSPLHPTSSASILWVTTPHSVCSPGAACFKSQPPVFSSKRRNSSDLDSSHPKRKQALLCI